MTKAAAITKTITIKKTTQQKKSATTSTNKSQRQQQQQKYNSSNSSGDTSPRFPIQHVNLFYQASFLCHQTEIVQQYSKLNDTLSVIQIIKFREYD